MKMVLGCEDLTTLVTRGTAAPPNVNDFAGGSFYLNTTTKRLYTRDGNDIRVLGTTAVPPVSAGLVSPANNLSMLSDDYKRLFGAGLFRMDGLFEAPVTQRSGLEYVQAARFIAPKTGVINRLKAYWTANTGTSTGYAAGDGGDIRIRIVPVDANDLPILNGAVHGQFTYTPRSNGMTGGKYPGDVQGFYEHTLGSLVQVVEGQRYAVVYDNLNSNPGSNWSTLDCAVSFSGNGRVNRWADPRDFAQLTGTRAAGSSGAFTWVDKTKNSMVDSEGITWFWSPILQLKYSDGTVFGDSTMETGNVELPNQGDRLWRLVPNHIGREVFNMPTARQFAGFTLQIGCEAAGTIRAVGYNPSGVQFWEMTKSFTPDTSWVTRGTRRSAITTLKEFAFPAPVSFPAGACAVDFEVVSGSFVAATERNGSLYGFEYPASFNISRARIKQGSGAAFINANFWNHESDNSPNIENWQIVLHGVSA